MSRYDDVLPVLKVIRDHEPVHDPKTACNPCETTAPATAMGLEPQEESRAIFFPAPGKCIDEARAICGACPVREQCLDFALTNGCIGVWGGTTERERSRLRQRNRTSARQLIGSS